MNLSKKKLTNYIDKLCEFAKQFLWELKYEKKTEMLNQIAGELKAASDLGILPSILYSPMETTPIKILKKPVTFRGHPEYINEEKTLEKFKKSICDCLSREAKKTLGIKETKE